MKMPAYQQLDSVREVMLIDADDYHAELYRRVNGHWGVELVRGAEASLHLASIDLRIPLFNLYKGIAMPNAAVDR